MNTVYVVLSSYNGERFLARQLDSILEQQQVRTKLLIRDDGSGDGTRKILTSYARQYDNIDVEFGKNIGVIDSFFTLFKKIPEDAELIALADQDDIWLPDKLQRAAAQLGPLSEPALYAACYNAIDEDSKFLWRSHAPEGAATFANAIVQNTITGCTAVINRQLLQRLKIDQVDSNQLVMHDWWVYLAATCFGQVIYDTVPNILYRQHSGNIVGVKNGAAFWWGRIQRFLHRNKNARIDQAQEFLRCNRNELSKQHKQLLLAFIAYPELGVWQRFRYALQTPLHMHNRIDDMILKLQMLLNSA